MMIGKVIVTLVRINHIAKNKRKEKEKKKKQKLKKPNCNTMLEMLVV